MKRSSILITLGIVILTTGGVTTYLLTRPKSTAPYLPKSQHVTTLSNTAPATPSSTRTTSTPTSPVDAPPSVPTSTTTAKNIAGTITLSSPLQGATITSGTKVMGTASTNNGQLYYIVKGKQSGQLASGVISVANNGMPPTTYSFVLNFTNGVVTGDQGVLEVYGLNAAGAEESPVSVGVNLQ